MTVLNVYIEYISFKINCCWLNAYKLTWRSLTSCRPNWMSNGPLISKFSKPFSQMRRSFIWVDKQFSVNGETTKYKKQQRLNTSRSYTKRLSIKRLETAAESVETFAKYVKVVVVFFKSFWRFANLSTREFTCMPILKPVAEIRIKIWKSNRISQILSF